jgi:DNA-binding CsgD family transcriptional regulator
MVDDGLSVAQIAREYGCGNDKARRILLARGIDIPGRRPPLTEEETETRAERIVEMFKSGLSLAAIGNTFGISRERVRQILKDLDLTGKDGGRSVRAQTNTLENRQDKACRKPAARRRSVPSRIARHPKPIKHRDLPTGVTFDAVRGVYVAQRRIGGVNYYIGSFGTPEAAHDAYLRFDHTKHRMFMRSDQNS